MRAWVKVAGRCCALPTSQSAQTSQSLPPSVLMKYEKCPYYSPSSATRPQKVVEGIPCSCYLPPPYRTATMMDGNHDVSLLLAWNSRWRSVKKIPMQEGKPSVSPCSSTAASRTIHAHPRSWGLAAMRAAAPPWDMMASFSS